MSGGEVYEIELVLLSQTQKSLSQVEEDIKEDMVYYRQTHTSFVDRMKANKEFQNPKILEQTVSYFGIDGNGTQFEPVFSLVYCNLQEVYDPKQFSPEDYASQLCCACFMILAFSYSTRYGGQRKQTLNQIMQRLVIWLYFVYPTNLS